MNHEIIEIETPYGLHEFVYVTNEDGSVTSFPVDENNESYLAWKAEQ